MDDITWLKSLKVGDEVCIEEDHSVKIAKIERLTPSGGVYIGNMKFNKHGICHIDKWHSAYLIPVTPELREKVLRGKLLARLTLMKWNQYDTPTLVKILNLIKPTEVDESCLP